ERHLDGAAAMHHLVYDRDEVCRTLFADVRRLAPGHVLAVSEGGSPRTWRHSRLEPASLGRASLGCWAERLRDTIEQAVADRLPATGRVGVHVSGGLDSSAVAAIMASALSADRARLVA